MDLEENQISHQDGTSCSNSKDTGHRGMLGNCQPHRFPAGRAPLPVEEAPLLLTSAATSAPRPARRLTLAAARAAAALVTATAAAAAEAATAARDDASAGDTLRHTCRTCHTLYH